MNRNEAIEKIDFIKETIEDAKIHYQGIWLMCFLLGGLYLMQFVTGMLQVALTGLQLYHYYIFFAFHVGLEIVALFCYLFIYRKEKKCTNKYYLSVLSIWGFVSIAVPVIISAVDFIGETFFSETYRMFSMAPAYICSEFSRVLLFSVFMITCSYILDNKFFRILSIVILFGYIFIYTCFYSKGIPFPFIPGQEQARIGYVTVYTVMVVDIGYLVMGVYLKYREGKAQEK